MVDSRLDQFLLSVGNIYERFQMENNQLTKLADGNVGGQRFILYQMQAGENLTQTLMYVVTPMNGGSVRIVATEGPTRNILLPYESSRDEMLIALDMILDHRESVAIFK